MYLAIYHATAKTHEGKVLRTKNYMVTLREAQGHELVQHWNTQGKRTGHQYGLLSVTRYTGDIDTLNWIDGLHYAHLAERQEILTA